MPLDESKTTYPPMDLRPRDAARLAERPCPPIAAHPDQWQRPYGVVLPRLHPDPNPLAPHRRA
jgi:hypothetical protein